MYSRPPQSELRGKHIWSRVKQQPSPLHCNLSSLLLGLKSEHVHDKVQIPLMLLMKMVSRSGGNQILGGCWVLTEGFYKEGGLPGTPDLIQGLRAKGLRCSGCWKAASKETGPKPEEDCRNKESDLSKCHTTHGSRKPLHRRLLHPCGIVKAESVGGWRKWWSCYPNRPEAGAHQDTPVRDLLIEAAVRGTQKQHSFAVRVRLTHHHFLDTYTGCLLRWRRLPF